MKVISSLLLYITLLLSPEELYSQPDRKINDSIVIIAQSSQVDSLFTPWSKSNSPGVAVLVMKDGKVLHRKGYGLANIQTKTPVSPESVFDLGSIGKQFTAMAIMILAERGHLSYDDKLTTFFPEFPSYAGKITIKHLLHHTAGLPEYEKLYIQNRKVKPDYETAYKKTSWAFEPTSKDLLALISEQTLPEFTAGDEWDYSNTGYVILGQIVEKISGISLSQFMKVNIFQPLGMNNTLLYDETKPKISNLAVSYIWVGNEIKGINYNALSLIYGDGGVNSSISDMANWYRAIENNTLIKASTLKQAFTSGKLNNGANVGYGYGWYVSNSLGLERMIHAGTWIGFKHEVAYYPEQHVTVLILSNDGRFTRTDRSALITQLTKIFLSDKMTFPTAVRINPAILKQYTGKYESETGESFEISIIGGALNVKPSGLLPIRLVPESAIKFFVDDSEDDRYVFRKDDKGKVIGLMKQLSLAGYTKFAYSWAKKL